MLNSRYILGFCSVLFLCALSATAQAVTTPTDCSWVNQERIIPGSECEALLDLFNSTNGEGWTNNTNWNQDNNPCGWEGVTCVSTPDGGFVQELNLDDHGMTGTLPESFGAGTSFSRLTYLNLRRNSIEGGIPASFGNLSSLTYFNMYWNNLSAPLPEEMKNLTSLEILTIGENQLTGGVPAWIGNLTNLVELDLSGNPLKGKIPPELGKLTNLLYIYLIDDQLEGPIPKELGNMSSLIDLMLGKNQLSGRIPASLGNLENLVFLALEDNQLCGEIPTSLMNLTNILDYTGSPPYGLHIYNNFLFTNNPALDAFLTSKGGDWKSTQGEMNCPSPSFWDLMLPAIITNR